MSWLKTLERLAKRLLVMALALVFRPPRRGLSVQSARKVLLVRIDARVGEALLTTPLLEALRERREVEQVHVLVHSRVMRVLDGHPAADRVIPFDRRRLWLGPLAPGIRALRREGYELVVDCGNWTEPAVTSALVSRLIAAKAVSIGPDVWPTRLLHSVTVAARQGTTSEWRQRLHLLSPLLGQDVSSHLSFRAIQEEPAVRAFLKTLTGQRLAIVNPGGRLGWRRIPAEVFAAAARTVLEAGLKPIITWGPGEESLAREVAEGAEGALVAPPSGIDGLASLMTASELTICNNTGPMHLSVALGVPTFALFLRMDLARWGHEAPPHRMLDLTPEFEAGSGVEPRMIGVLRGFLSALPSRAG